MLYLFEKCMERAFQCNLSWGLTHRYVKMLGPPKSTFWFHRADLAVLLSAVYSVQSGLAEWRQRAPCDMASGPVKWKSQDVLVAISRGATPPVAGMGSRTWGLFRKLRIPGWDYNFVRRAL